MRKNFLGVIILLLGSLLTHSLSAQEEKSSSFRVQLDARNTFVNDEAVGIFGIRAGFLINQKYEFGVGLYGSRLFDALGTEVEKGYVDNSLTPSQTFPARIGFDYVSFFGEYVVSESSRWRLTANSQFGIGRVNIRLTDGNEERLKREGKNMIEHSVKGKYKLLPWLEAIGGIGYRYLLSGEKQITKAFNSPVYIITAEIDFKALMESLKKKK